MTIDYHIIVTYLLVVILLYLYILQYVYKAVFFIGYYNSKTDRCWFIIYCSLIQIKIVTLLSFSFISMFSFVVISNNIVTWKIGQYKFKKNHEFTFLRYILKKYLATSSVKLCIFIWDYIKLFTTGTIY